MLYLARKVGESIIINNTIEVKVMEVRGKTVKLGFSFPPDATILRKEIHDRIREENLAAAGAQAEAMDLLLGDLSEIDFETGAPDTPAKENKDG